MPWLNCRELCHKLISLSFVSEPGDLNETLHFPSTSCFTSSAHSTLLGDSVFEANMAAEGEYSLSLGRASIQ